MYNNLDTYLSETQSYNLFISNTPYHLSLNVAIIKKNNLENNILILYEDFNIDSKELKWLDRYYEKIYIIKTRYIYMNDKNNKIKMINKRKIDFQQFIKIRNIINKLRKFKFGEIFFSNDSLIQTQVIINELKDINTQISYVEDGSAAYHDINHPNRSVKVSDYIKLNTYALYALLYNYKYKTFNTFGVLGYVNKGYFLYPGLVRDEYTDKIKREIDHDKFREAECERKDISKENIPYIQNSIVFIVDLYRKENLENYANIVKVLSENTHKIYIKYHPREQFFYLDKLLNHNVKKVNYSGSVESLLVNTTKNIVITSGITTALMTIPVLSKNNIVTISEILGVNINDRYKEIIKKIGVKEAKSIEQLLELIEFMEE